ncbi:MAG: DUF4943 family protein [Bacteroides sp.]|nr:DUF4943 family protein [Bacteroides sp.]
MKQPYRLNRHLTARWGLVALLVCMALLGSACHEEMLDYNHPDAALFVKQLKSGKYSVQGSDGVNHIPHFTMDDIEYLLEHAEDMTLISSFPLAPVSYSAGGKLRLGECILWTIETIRLGRFASMGCKMVHTDADNYEGIYFLSDAEVRDAAERYRRWWEGRKLPRTMWTVDPCYDEPLCGSGYMWW